jgi:predicted DsbA family dithiol-disulfide isomerase
VNGDTRNPISTMNTIHIDFVSDVACPWCAVGLGSVEQAIANLGDAVQVSIRFQPFQLNPAMPPEGQDITEHLRQKYGSSAEQQAQTYEAIRQRGAEVGFEFRLGGRGRTWNTFDCHRLLEWAHEVAPEQQLPLKKALLKAYFTEGLNPGAHDVLLRICSELGLDVTRAADMLRSDDYTAPVRARQQFYAQNQITSVPAVIINEQYLISGGQPVASFESALRKIANL